MKSEPGKRTARGSGGGSVFTAEVIKDAQAKYRFTSMTGAGTSLMSHSGSTKASAGTDLLV